MQPSDQDSVVLLCVEETFIPECVCCVFDESKIDIGVCFDRGEVDLGWFMITIPVFQVPSIFIPTYSSVKNSMLIKHGVIMSNCAHVFYRTYCNGLVHPVTTKHMHMSVTGLTVTISLHNVSF